MWRSPRACTTVATSDLAGRIIEQKEFLTDPDPDKTVQEVIALVREFSFRNKGSIEAVGVSLPGLVDPVNRYRCLRSLLQVARHSYRQDHLNCVRTPCDHR